MNTISFQYKLTNLYAIHTFKLNDFRYLYNDYLFICYIKNYN